MVVLLRLGSAVDGARARSDQQSLVVYAIDTPPRSHWKGTAEVHAAATRVGGPTQRVDTVAADVSGTPHIPLRPGPTPIGPPGIRPAIKWQDLLKSWMAGVTCPALRRVQLK